MTQLLTKAQTEAKGFALYVGISESEAQAAGTTLAEIASKLRETIAELLPEKASETYATLAIAPANAAGRNLDITSGELGLAGHWIKRLLHTMFIYKAKWLPGWSKIPE